MNTNNRTLAYDTLRFWLVQHGELSKEKLAIATGIKVAKLDRLLCGRKRPSETEMIILCLHTGIGREELFPSSGQGISA